MRNCRIPGEPFLRFLQSRDLILRKGIRIYRCVRNGMSNGVDHGFEQISRSSNLDRNKPVNQIVKDLLLCSDIARHSDEYPKYNAVSKTDPSAREVAADIHHHSRALE